MRKLDTIQEREVLNKVFAVDEKGKGNANHFYSIQDEDGMTLCNIEYQNGARKEKGSIRGVTDQDLLEIVRDRLDGFQNGEMPTKETEEAMYHVEEALEWLNRRIENRIERGVLGKEVK